MNGPRASWVGALLTALLASCASHALAHPAKANERLPTVGMAPGFTLTAQSGERVALEDLRGKVLAVTFI